jgi:hypothetical protein
MADAADALLWTARPPVPRQPQHGELLFEFLRPSDRAAVRCELRFHGESYGWEVRFYEGTDEFFARGGFPLRCFAILWAEHQRNSINAVAGRTHKT